MKRLPQRYEIDKPKQSVHKSEKITGLDNKNCNLQLSVNNEMISQEALVKHLAINFDNSLSFKSHINNVTLRLSVQYLKLIILNLLSQWRMFFVNSPPPPLIDLTPPTTPYWICEIKSGVMF